MAAISVLEYVSLDGVMQGPGRPDEDTRGGFRHGGWTGPYQDEVLAQYAGEGMRTRPGLLFGRRTYEDVLGHWTSSGPNPFVDVLLAADKFVVSRTPGTALAHPNSTLLAGEAADTVAALKQERDADLLVMGSGELVRALHRAGLIDRFILQVHPIVLGSGTRLFEEGDPVGLHLERSIRSTTGVLVNEYSVVR